MTWRKAFKAVEPYIVKIETPAGAGTGFFFAYNEDKSIIAVATALHVIEEADQWRQPVKIIRINENKELFLSHDERGIVVDYKRDSAVILVPTARVTASGLPVPAAMLSLLPSDKVKSIGVSLAWAGYPAIASRTLCLFQGGVSAFNADNDSYYIDGIAINGVSGGPVFDDKDDLPKIVGIVSAYRYNRQGGGNLPGLLMAHDATHLNDTVENLKSLDDARKKAAEAAKEQREQEAHATAGPTEPESPRQDVAQPERGSSEPPRRVRRKRRPSSES